MQIIAGCAAVLSLLGAIWFEVAIATGTIPDPGPRRGRHALFFLTVAFGICALTPFGLRRRRSRSEQIMDRARRQHGLVSRSVVPTIVSGVVALGTIVWGLWIVLPPAGFLAL
jgi:hypothetical protein